MAIERQTPDLGNQIPVDVDMTTTVSGDGTEEDIIDVLDEFQEANVEIQEDGSALLGPAPEMMMSSEFGENLAEILPPSELARIYIDLVGSIEDDRSSREDWEKNLYRWFEIFRDAF